MDVVRIARGTPLYAQVAADIAKRIEDGTLAAGARLPSEREFAQQLGLSRVTIRRALQELASAGRIEAAPGHAWFVKPSVIEGPENALQSFTQVSEARGCEARAKVTLARLRPCTLEEAELLRVAPGSELVELVRVRFMDDIPIALDASLVPHGRAPGLLGLDWTRTSLFATFRDRYHVTPTRTELSVEAEAATPRVASALRMAAGAPVLVTEGVTYDGQSRPIHYGRTTYRADRYRFHANRTLISASRGLAPRASA